MNKRKAMVAALLFASSLFATTTPPVPRQQPVELKPQEPPKKGRWHMAEDGHAVYCYGPVVTLESFLMSGEAKRYATQCRGQSKMVPLKD